MRVWAVALLIMVGISGCIGGDAPTPPPWNSAVYGDGAVSGEGTATGPERVDGGVMAMRQGDHWIASRTVSFTGSIGTFSRIDVDVQGFNGDIDFTQGSGFRFTVDAYGRGETEADARNALDKMTVDSTRSSSDDVLLLRVAAERDGRLARDQGNGVAITAALPTGPAYIWRADTSNGDITAPGHRGPAALLDTSNGEVDWSGETDLLWMDSSNGELTVTGTAINAELDTSNGEITGSFLSVASGKHTFDTSNGEVILTYGGDAAYDVQADTSNGEAFIDLPGAEDVGRQDEDDAHRRSAGYDDAAVQVMIVADTSNAEIMIRAD